MTDPASGHAAPVIGTWLSTLATFLLLASNGHLMLIARVADSYAAWPPGGPPPGAGVMTALVGFGGHVFAAGVTIALPVAAALILIQLAMAVLTRAAPQLNLFAVGFPVTIMAGLALLAMALPVMAGAIQASIDAGLAAGAALGALD
jgi:flagellar biosynthetic protein FliR